VNRRNRRRRHDNVQPCFFFKRALLAAGFATVVSAPAMGTRPGQIAEAELDPESAAIATWSALMARSPSAEEGCFHASYPDIVWERVPCKISQPRSHPTHVRTHATKR
jgi:hypothetical protein